MDAQIGVVVMQPKTIEEWTYDNVYIRNVNRVHGPFMFDKTRYLLTGRAFCIGGHEGTWVGLANTDKRTYTQWPIPRRLTQNMDKARASPGIYHYMIRDECWAIQNSVLRALNGQFKVCDTVQIFAWNDDTAVDDPKYKFPIHFVHTAKIRDFNDHGIKIQEGHGDQTGLHISYWKIKESKAQTRLGDYA